jgi:Dolichyl-phosphate-mannose-protein mannosyltransferase
LLVSSGHQSPRMQRLNNSQKLWLTIVAVASVPRILGAFLLPNAFGDAYVYIRDIGTLSTRLSSHTFVLTDLYGFWMPLYQFISAALNVFLGNGFYSGKLVSAVFGIGVCLFVYGITLRLTANRSMALLGFFLIALNPLHIFYSASAMTDVPHAFFVLASLYFVLSENWIVAALFAALAGLTRVESWMFLALIPAIQFIRERRVSTLAIIVLIISPLFWFYLSWKATGNWLACFVARRQYLDWLLAANPTIAHFSFQNIFRDGATLLVSADVAVLAAAFVAGWKIFKRPAELLTNNSESFSIFATLVYFFSFLGLLLIAYLTHQQPIIFPRYGLLLFSLGIPILAWTVLAIKKHDARKFRRVFIWVIVICVFDASVQLVGSVGEINRYAVQRTVADYLRDHFPRDGHAHIFCDEGTVQALSGIPADRFLTSFDAPRELEGFLKFLDQKDVEYLVFVVNQDLTLNKLFPNLEFGKGPFELITNRRATFLPTNIWVYRLPHGGAIARP